jgi:hypothetical protein
LAAQREVVHNLQRQQVQNDRLSDSIGRVLADLDALPAVLLRRAFKGAL